MTASSKELNEILAYFPDGATIRITYPAIYFRLTSLHNNPSMVRAYWFLGVHVPLHEHEIVEYSAF